jgi:hypothetical protein
VASDSSAIELDPKVLVFNAPDWHIPHLVIVTGVADDVDTADVSVEVVVGPASTEADLYGELDPVSVSVTVVDDDVAGLVEADAVGDEVAEGEVWTLWLVLTSEPRGVVTLTAEATVGDESVPLTPSAIEVAPEDWEVPVAFAWQTVDDAVAAGDVEAWITTGSLSADSAYDGLGATYSVVVRDNDAAGVLEIESGPDSVVEGSSWTASFLLLSKPTAVVRLTAEMLEGQELGSLQASTLEILPDAWEEPVTFAFEAGSDRVDGDGGKVKLSIGTASSDDATYAARTDEPGAYEFEVVDDDTAGVLVDAGDGVAVGEVLPPDSFSVALDSEPTAPVEVAIESSDPTEASVDPDVLTFTPEDWDQPQTVTVTGIQDGLLDETQEFVVLIQPAESDDQKYQALDADDLPATNTCKSVVWPRIWIVSPTRSVPVNSMPATPTRAK